MSASAVRFDHLAHMSDAVGLFEHACGTTPRVEHGYCVDDVARGLVVTLREPALDARGRDLSATYLAFVCAAQASDGRFHNRRNTDGAWTDLPSLEDCWGRALWGLGTAVGRGGDPDGHALEAFERGGVRRSPWSRSMAFAALGAAEVITVLPDHPVARQLLWVAANLIGRPGRGGSWPWPEPRLRYANAALAETLLAAGSLLGDRLALENGLTMLRWLVDVETRDGHLSVTPVGGWYLGEPRPGFDQQPIEVAALADACARAAAITGDRSWHDTIELCGAWFEGRNDVGVAMLDPADGSGFDGLEPHSRNENRGAESTLAMLSTMQQVARVLVPSA